MKFPRDWHIRSPSTFRRRSFSTRGVAVLEFALLAPVFLALVYGIVVYGLYFATWVAVTQAASEGARASLAGLSTGDRQTLAANAIAKVFTSYAPLMSAQNTSVTYPPASNANLFAVAVSYDLSNTEFQVLAGFVPLPSAAPTVTVTVSNGRH